MKSKLFAVIMLVSLLFAFAAPANVQAAAYGLTFTTSITYQNVSASPATIGLTFYATQSGTGIPITRPELPSMAASSLFIGSLTELGTGFNGSAVMTSNVPVVATLVQLPPSGSTVKVRPLSNGMAEGSSYVLVPTVLKNTFNKHSMVSIQNVDGVAADLTVTFKPVSGSNIVVPVNNLPSGSAYFVNMATAAEITAASFNGSLTVQSVKHGTSTPGAVVVVSMELGITNDEAYAFDGFTVGANKIYMPSAFCKWGAYDNVSSAFAVQNFEAAGGADAVVTVTYSNGHVDGPVTIAPGAKGSFPGCGISGTLNGVDFLGSAVIESTGGRIVAIGKVGGDGGYSTAYSGFAQGYSKITMPYVRWSQTQYTTGSRQQVNIAIQNVGNAEIGAGVIQIKYYDVNGLLVGTDTNPSAIPVYGKYSSNAFKLGSAGAEFGYAVAGVIGGGAVVEAPSGTALAVIGRVCTYNTSLGVAACEDYNGIPIQ